MFCPACQSSKPPSDRFCDFCGLRLLDQPPTKVPAPAQPVSDTAHRLAVVEQEVRALKREVGDLRHTLAARGVPVPERPSLAPAPAAQPQAGGLGPSGSGHPPPAASYPTPQPAAASAARDAPPPARHAQPRAGAPAGRPLGPPGASWEMLLGINWLGFIGAVAFVMGVGFFLKLAFDNNWIGEVGRVVLGIVGGLAWMEALRSTRRVVSALAPPQSYQGSMKNR